jgi:hypothetical protein
MASCTRLYSVISLSESSEAGQQSADRGHALLHVAAHVLPRIQRGFLLKEADAQPWRVPQLPVEGGVHSGHDAQQGALPRAIAPQHPDLGAGEEGQGEILDDLLGGRVDLAQVLQGEDELVAHGIRRRVRASQPRS